MKTITFFLAALTLLNGCFINDSVDGNGNITTKSYDFSNFNQIKISSNLQADIVQGNDFQVLVRTDENLQKYIDIDQQNGILRIETDRPVNLDPTGDIEVRLVMPEVKRIEGSGASGVMMTKAFRQDEPLSVYLSGASKAKIYAIIPSLGLNISGASHLTMKGNAPEASINLSGASKLDAEEFEFGDVEVGVSGASHAKISVTEKINATASGAGSIKYHKLGDVKVKSNSSGAGSVEEFD